MALPPEMAQTIESLRGAVARNPRDAQAWNKLGVALYTAGEAEEAIEALERAAAEDADSWAGFSNLGVVLMYVGRWEESAETLRKAQRRWPENAQITMYLSAVMGMMGEVEERRANLERAKQLDPQLAAAPWFRWSQAMVHLAAGELERGWEEFEARLEIPALGLNRGFAQPQWDGSAGPGKTVLLHAEGGFGDTIHYVRYIEKLPRRGEIFLLEAQGELVDLLAPMRGVERIIRRGERLPHFDYHIPLPSLPRVLRIRMENIPGKAPYLFAPAQRVQRWRGKFAGVGGFKVGLTWAGSDASLRSDRIEIFAPLAKIENVRFFSLQKGPQARQAPPAGMNLTDLMSEAGDFADTAAIMQELDLIIGVDTAAIHLAGALARPVWAVIPRSSYFMYFLNRTDSPYYPTLRLFRQTRIHSWAEPVEQMAEVLRKLAGGSIGA